MPLGPCTVSPKQSLALPRHVVRKSSVLVCAAPAAVCLAPAWPAARWRRSCSALSARRALGSAAPCGSRPGGGGPVESLPHAKAALSLNNLGRRRAGRARGNGHGGGVRRRAWTHRGEEGTARGPPQTRPPAPAPGPVAQGRGVPALSSRSPGKSSGGTCPPTAPRRKR